MPSWLSTHYDESKRNNCSIICSIFSCFLCFLELLFQEERQFLPRSNLAVILNFTTHSCEGANQRAPLPLSGDLCI